MRPYTVTIDKICIIIMYIDCFECLNMWKWTFSYVQEHRSLSAVTEIICCVVRMELILPVLCSLSFNCCG